MKGLMDLWIVSVGKWKLTFSWEDSKWKCFQTSLWWSSKQITFHNPASVYTKQFFTLLCMHTIMLATTAAILAVSRQFKSKLACMYQCTSDQNPCWYRFIIEQISMKAFVELHSPPVQLFPSTLFALNAVSKKFSPPIFKEMHFRKFRGVQLFYCIFNYLSMLQLWFVWRSF